MSNVHRPCWSFQLLQIECFTRNIAHNIRGSWCSPTLPNHTESFSRLLLCYWEYKYDNIQTVECAMLILFLLIFSFSSFRSLLSILLPLLLHSSLPCLIQFLLGLLLLQLLCCCLFSLSLFSFYMSVCKHFVWMKWMWNLIISTYRLCYWIHTLCWVRIMRNVRM